MANQFLPLSATTLLLFLSLLIVTTSSTTDDDTLVLDVDGNPLEAGSPYYIRTELSKVGIGGGLVAASKPNRPQCPQYVAQLAAGWEGESPVTFYPADPSHKHIHLSSDLNIVFNTTSSACSQGAWQLTPDPTNGNLYLSTGGDTGNPGSQSLASSLKIETSYYGEDGLYQIEYCPSTTKDSNKKDIVCGVINTLDFSDDFRLSWVGLKTFRPDNFHLLTFLKA